MLKVFDDALLFDTRKTLNRTVFDNGRHWPANEARENQIGNRREAGWMHEPTVTTSPSSTRKAGEAWAARFLCLFSYRSRTALLEEHDMQTTSIARTVLGDVMQIITTNDNGAGHLGRHDFAGEDASADRDFACEGALLV